MSKEDLDKTEKLGNDIAVTVSKVIEQITWYNQLHSDFTGITDILHARKQIATQGVFLATLVSRARKAWKFWELDFDLKKNEYRIQFEDKGTTLASVYAKQNTEVEAKRAAKAEADFYHADYFLKSLKEVLSEMNQRIAVLRKEVEEEKFLDG